MERNGEDVTLKQLIYNAVDIFVPGTDVLLKNLYFPTLSEKEDILFSTLYTVLSNDTLYHDIVTDSTLNITVQMYPCSEGTDTGNPVL